jgi:hypothetical protein
LPTYLSLFSHLLKSHSKVAITTLENLSKTQARQFAKALKRVNGLPWKLVIIIDSKQHLENLRRKDVASATRVSVQFHGIRWRFRNFRSSL